MIDRRSFISAVTLGILTAPLGVEAQPAGKAWRIGYLQGSSREAQTSLIQAFEGASARRATPLVAIS